MSPGQWILPALAQAPVGCGSGGVVMQFDVLVVGCGPVGALAANLLGRAGLNTLVVEQELEPHPLPRAVHLDHEAMRLLQSAGVAGTVSSDMREAEGHLHVGADHGVIRYMGTAGRPKPYGWANDYFFYQPEFEEHLRQALTAYPNVELRLGVAFESLAQDADGVTVVLGDGTRARSRWVIACDGARSAVRKQLGVALDDLDFDEPWLVVDAEVEGPVRFPDLADVPAGANLQRLSVMMCDPRRPATVVPGRGNHRRWEFMLLPGEEEEAMMRPDKVAELLSPYLEGVPHRLVRAATYRFHGLVAERWQVGRVFLAGDAAHQTPPFFGQGMCHGFRDVANLAWKLQLVERGGAPASLMTTYQAERDPHVRQVISAAIDAGRYICLLDPAAAAARDAQMRAQAREATPRTAADLIPPIHAGLVAAGAPGAGQRFVQPKLDAGRGERLLDELGQGWRLVVAREAMAAAAGAAAAERLPRLPLQVIAADAVPDGGALADWLEARSAAAVLVRPDHYLFGGAADAEALEPLLDQLARGLYGEAARPLETVA